MEHLFSLKDAAAVLRVHPDTLRRRIVAGTVPAVRVGKLYRLHPATVRRIAEAGFEGGRDA